MAKLPPNPFQITAYYSGNTCIIDTKHHYQTCEVLCKLFDYHPEHDLALMRDELKSLLQTLLFKFDVNYSAWENYDKNVYRAQKVLNDVKELLCKLPLYRYITNPDTFDYEDLIHCLSLHSPMFDKHYDDGETRAEEDDEKKKMRERGVPEDAIKKMFDPLEEDEEDYEEGFEDPNEQYSFHEDARYKERDYGFYDSHVLESVLSFKDDMRHFQPYWYNDDQELEDYLGAELLNNDLRAMIEPYIDLLDTLTHLPDTYGRFLDEYIHSRDKFLTDAEIAEVYEKYVKVEERQIIKPSGVMSLECKPIKQGSKSVWCDVYTFNSLSAFLYFDFFRGLRSGFIPKRCVHCGRYFLLTSGRYYDFCERAVKGTNGKTCRDIGAHKKYEEKCKSDPIWLAYNRAYKNHYSRVLKKKMTKSEFRTWSDWAKVYRDKAIAGKVRIGEYEKRIRK